MGKPFSKKRIRDIAKEEDLDQDERIDLADFMWDRFGATITSEDYVREWAYRWKKEHRLENQAEKDEKTRQVLEEMGVIS